jgi:uroporphyrinogen decarboxylase
MSDNHTSKKIVADTIAGKSGVPVPKGELVLDNDAIKEHFKVSNVDFDTKNAYALDLGVDIIVLPPVYDFSEAFPNIKIPQDEISQWTNMTDFFNFSILDGAFELGIKYYGFEKFLSMILKKSDETKDFIKRVSKMNIEVLSAISDLGIDGTIIADDIAYQGGLIIRPSLFKDLFLTSLEHQVEYAHKNNLVPFFHSDGNYVSIIDEIVDAGFKGIHCIDQVCKMDLSCLKDYAGKICLWGHLDVNHIEKSKTDVGMKLIADEIRKTTNFRGFILGTNSGIFPGMDVMQLKKIYDYIAKESER